MYLERKRLWYTCICEKPYDLLPAKESDELPLFTPPVVILVSAVWLIRHHETVPRVVFDCKQGFSLKKLV